MIRSKKATMFFTSALLLFSITSIKIVYDACNFIFTEEIFKSQRAIWFSPNGKYLAYAKFDDSNVPTDHVTSYSQTRDQTVDSYVYPKIFKFPYSKVLRYSNILIYSDKKLFFF